MILEVSLHRFVAQKLGDKTILTIHAWNYLLSGWEQIGGMNKMAWALWSVNCQTPKIVLKDSAMIKGQLLGKGVCIKNANL